MGLLFDSCISLAKVLIRSRRYQKPQVDNSRDCFVLGNGPALKKALEKDPDYFLDKHVCVVNSFATADEYLKIKPASYFIKDGLYFWIDQDEYDRPENTWRESLSMGEKNGVVTVAKSIRAIKERTSWPLLLYIPFWARHSLLVREVTQNKNIKIVYFNNVKVSGYQWLLYRFIYPRGLGNPQFQNVVQMALFQKVNEGFKKIFLSGVNANFHQYLQVGDDNRLYTVQHHFYHDQPQRNLLSDRDSRGNYTPQPIWKQFDSLKRLFYGFQLIRAYADSRKCTIINTSKESFIDAFERSYIFD